jgi:ribosome-binding factor A
MAQGERAARVAEQIQREAARILLEEASDPLLRGITVTGVRVSPDLRHARILYAAGAEQREEIERRARKFEPFLQRELAGRIRLRYAVEIALRWDDGFENAQRLERIFAELGAGRHAAAADGAGAPATDDPGSGRDPGDDRDPGRSGT